MALVQKSWSARDLEPPSIELTPDQRGKLLHKAVQWIKAQDLQKISLENLLDLIDTIWVKQKPSRLKSSLRVKKLNQNKLAQILWEFCQAEIEWLSSTQAKVWSLEGPRLELNWKGQKADWKIIGIPDRIDCLHLPDEPVYWLMDYKTSPLLPKGCDVFQIGYRPQLALYALALEKDHGLKVAGAQYVQLTLEGSRSKGIFKAMHNASKKAEQTPLTITKFRKQNLSVIDDKNYGDLFWQQIFNQVEPHLLRWELGDRSPSPLILSECQSCSLTYLCGQKRKTKFMAQTMEDQTVD